MNLLLVVLGGGIGAGGRYLLVSWLNLQLGNGFPWGTFAVNALGSLMVGLVFGPAQSKAISPDTTLFFTVGVLGGFTASSAFSFETLRLITNGVLAASTLNAAGQLSVGLLAGPLRGLSVFSESALLETSRPTHPGASRATL